MSLLLIYIWPALSFNLGKAGSFFIPCPFKYFTHMDCPGCGFQRALVALVRGDFEQSFVLYPPTIPLLVCAFLGIGATILKLNTNAKSLKICYILTGYVIIINYAYKVLTHHLY